MSIYFFLAVAGTNKYQIVPTYDSFKWLFELQPVFTILGSMAQDIRLHIGITRLAYMLTPNLWVYTLNLKS